MILALILTFTINTTEIYEAGDRIDILLRNIAVNPQGDYIGEIKFIRDILTYNENKNTVTDLNTSRLKTVISIYNQTLYEIEEYLKTNNDKYLRAALIDKTTGDTILNELNSDLSKNKKGS